MFDKKDFDAYLPQKWTDHMYNLERMRVKDKLADLEKQLLKADIRIFKTLQSALSSDTPSLWNGKEVTSQCLYFFRNREEQLRLNPFIEKHKGIRGGLLAPAASEEHITLALSVNQNGADAGIKVYNKAWPDFENIIGKLNIDVYLSELSDMFEKLGDDYTIIIQADGAEQPLYTSKLTDVDFSALPALLEEHSGDVPAWLNITKVWNRDTPFPQKPEFLKELVNIFNTVDTVFRFLMWTPQNDFTGLADEITRTREAATQKIVSTIKPGCMVRIKSGALAGKKAKVSEVSRSGSITVVLGLFTKRLNISDVELL